MQKLTFNNQYNFYLNPNFPKRIYMNKLTKKIKNKKKKFKNPKK